MLTVVITTLSVVVCVYALHIVYRVFENEWPSSYFSAADALAPEVSRGPVRYLGFRLIPYSLVVIVSASAVRGLSGHVGWFIAGVTVVYVARTTGIATWRLLRSGSPLVGSPLKLHVTTIVLLTAASFLSYVIFRAVAAAIPGPRELFGALLTGAFAALLTNYFRIVLQPADRQADELLARARKAFESAWREPLWESTVRWEVDHEVALAILHAELVNRPRWTRRSERLLGRVRPRGTYGPLQVMSDEPLSDAESIRQGIARLQIVAMQRSPHGDLGFAVIEAVIERHNPDSKFVELAQDFYARSEFEEGRSSEEVLPNGVGVVRVRRSQRRGISWIITGDADPRVSAVTVRRSSGVETTAALERRAPDTPGGRSSLHAEVPVTENLVTLSWTTEEGSGIGRTGSVDVGLY